jgi:hypothetical protein
MENFEKGDLVWTLAFDVNEIIQVPIEFKLDDSDNYLVSYQGKDFVLPVEYLHKTKADAIRFFEGG